MSLPANTRLAVAASVMLAFGVAGERWCRLNASDPIPATVRVVEEVTPKPSLRTAQVIAVAEVPLPKPAPSSPTETRPQEGSSPLAMKILQAATILPPTDSLARQSVPWRQRAQMANRIPAIPAEEQIAVTQSVVEVDKNSAVPPPPSPALPPAEEPAVVPTLPPAQELPGPAPAPAEPTDLPPPLLPAEVVPVPRPQNPATPAAQPLPEDRPIGQVTAGITAGGDLFPENVAARQFNADIAAWMPRPWEGALYFWDAPDYCHRPLRYEEVNLERYGYSHAPLLQPAISGAHFFCATLALPYNSTVHPPHECIYPLGHYRPGSPVPYRIHWPEWDAKAAAVEAAAVGGLIILIP